MMGLSGPGELVFPVCKRRRSGGCRDHGLEGRATFGPRLLATLFLFAGGEVDGVVVAEVAVDGVGFVVTLEVDCEVRLVRGIGLPGKVSKPRADGLIQIKEGSIQRDLGLGNDGAGHNDARREGLTRG